MRHQDETLLAWLSEVPTHVYIVIIVVVIGLLLLLSGDFGASWDIAPQEFNGLKAYTFYFKGFDSAQFRTNHVSMYYGPVVNVLIWIVQSISGNDTVLRFEIRVVIQALISLSSLIPVFLISSRVISKPLALISACLVASTPLFFGHAFINPKDSIFASAYVWALFLIIFCFVGRQRPSYAAYAGVGVVIGLMTSLRIVGAGLLIVVLLATTVLPALLPGSVNVFYKHNSIAKRILYHTALHYRGLALLFFTFVLTYTLSMPGILSNFTIGTYLEVFHTFAHYPWFLTNLYFGNSVPAEGLPWHYIYGYMLVQFPLYYHFFLLTILAAVITWPRITIRRLHHLHSREQASSTVILVLVALIIPLGLNLILRPGLYDAFRHLLFVVPLISMLLYFGFLGVLTAARGFSRMIMVIIAVLCWTEAVVAMRWLHPYEYVYYNPLVQPADTFELDYLGTSFREVAEYINDYAKEDILRGGKIRVLVCGPLRALSRFLDRDKFEVISLEDFRPPFSPDNDTITGACTSAAASQLTVAVNRFNCMSHVKKPWLMSVGRRNLVFAAVARSC